MRIQYEIAASATLLNLRHVMPLDSRAIVSIGGASNREKVANGRLTGKQTRPSSPTLLLSILAYCPFLLLPLSFFEIGCLL